MRPWSVAAAVAAACLVSLPAPAMAAQADGANCDGRQVMVTGHDVPVRAQPRLGAAHENVMSRGERHNCGGVKVGGYHNLCGATESNVWMIITDNSREVYVPSHCVADIRR